MGFLSPWFLAGLAVLGLPIWLHLLKQFKRTPRPFSSLLFFERRLQSSTRHRRLRYRALLLLRLALLVLLAIAFANPFLRSQANAVKRRSLTVIAVDRSFSMRAQGRMSDAKSEAQRIVDGLRGRASAQVLAFDSHVEALTQPVADKGALRSAIETIQAGDANSSYGELSRALRVMEQTSGMHLDVHVVTDLQQTSMPASFADLQVGPHTTETLHGVGKPVANWAVESVSVPARIYGSTTANVSAVLASWNAGDAKRKVSVYLDGRLVASKDVSVPSCGRAPVEFDSIAIPFGVHRGEVRIDGQDALPNDDRFSFSIERSDPRKVLFLYSGGRSGDALYYKSALGASAATGLRVQPFPLEQVSAKELADSAFFVLDNPGRLDAGIAQLLSEYVQKGGAGFIAAGAHTVESGTVPIAGNELVRTNEIQGAGRVNDKSAALSGVGQFQNVQFINSPRISVKQNDTVVARLADSSPLLVKEPLGNGRILIFGSTLDNTANDFPLHSSFLPFVAQTAAYLSGAVDTPSSVVVGTPITLRQAGTQATAADVVGPGQRHELSLADATRALSYSPASEGFYDVQRADGRRLLVAAHSDRRESDLTQIPADTLSLWSNTGAKVDDTAAATEKATVPWSLWRYVLILAAIAALVESLFASRYLKEERQPS